MKTRSLALYSRRPRKRLSPEASLQVTVVEHLRLRGVSGLLYFHPCNEGKRSAAMGLHLKRMGMLPGVADLVIIVPGEPVLFLELKAQGGKPSDDQLLFQAAAIDAGCRYRCADNIDEALRILAMYRAIGPRRAQVTRREAA